MRPVNKGTSPYTPIQEYRDALPYLESRIRSKGFFSVWLEVFKDEPEIKICCSIFFREQKQDSLMQMEMLGRFFM